MLVTGHCPVRGISMTAADCGTRIGSMCKAYCILQDAGGSSLEFALQVKRE